MNIFYFCYYNSLIPDEIVSLDMMDRVFFFNLCINCLSIIDAEVVDRIQFVIDENDLTHSICLLLVDEFIVFIMNLLTIVRKWDILLI